MARQKKFKSEYHYGGAIVVTVMGTDLLVKAGEKQIVASTNSVNWQSSLQLEMEVEGLTSAYHAEKVVSWIDNNVNR